MNGQPSNKFNDHAVVEPVEGSVDFNTCIIVTRDQPVDVFKSHLSASLERSCRFTLDYNGGRQTNRSFVTATELLAKSGRRAGVPLEVCL